MKTALIILASSLILAGCRTSNEIEVTSLTSPEMLPSYSRAMTLESAADALGMAPPVEVDWAASFADGGTVKVMVRDRDGKYMELRRTPWCWGTPIEFYLKTYDGRGLEELKKLLGKHTEIKVNQDDPRLKAFSLLALDWVDRNFTRRQQRRLRDTQDLLVGKENDAATILYLFRPE